MIRSIAKELVETENENSNPNVYRYTSSKLLTFDFNNFKTLDPYSSKNSAQKGSSSTFLTENNYQFKNVKQYFPTNDITNNTRSIHKELVYSDENEKDYSVNQNTDSKIGLTRYHSSRYINIMNIPSLGLFNKKKNLFPYFDSNDIKNVNNNNNILGGGVSKNNISKIIETPFLEDDVTPKKEFTSYENHENSNFNTDILYNENNTNNFSDNTIVNNTYNNLTNNEANSTVNNTLSLDNININTPYIEDEPNTNFKLSDFEILNQIGKGAEGTIYKVRWKKNNKEYAMKKCEIIFDEVAKKKKQENNIIKEFIQSTGCEGVIKIFDNLCSTNKFGTHYFYELMELADKDWDSEITNREKKNLYYQEYELMDIFTHLIKTFSALQSIRFTHRDINPQNIMFVNGKLKICDFGNSKILKKEGLIIQKIRGSELFMSPILFKGYHAGVQTIRHNAFKSDVFSLGMCFFLAASLKYDALNAIREVYDMNIIKKIVNKYIGKKYSQNLITLLLTMLQVDEKKRPDFSELELLLP